MQRWLINEENDGSEGACEMQAPKQKVRGANHHRNCDVVYRSWKFTVLMTQTLSAHEQIAITGDCQELGEWDPVRSVLMERNPDEGSEWFVTVDLPAGARISYRYYVCAHDPTTEKKHIRKFETHLKPRGITIENGTVNESKDTFGDIDGVEKIDRGWLTDETIVQFKFFNEPFTVKSKLKNRSIYVKITPMVLRMHTESTHTMSQSLDESLSNDTRDNLSEQPAFAFTEVVSLKGSQCRLEPQPQFGTPFQSGDFLLFHVTVAEPELVAYLIDLYTYSSRASEDDPPNHLGYHYILPNMLKKSEDFLEVPITCASKHRPLGMMRVGYLKITPLKTINFNLGTSFTRHWNPKWTGLDVGHRGSGTSFKTRDGGVIRENTIASLKKAAAHGADMVEFDVQLSKDLVPVIYHDFSIYVSLKKKKVLDDHDMLELPVRDLTLEQLKNLKVYHVEEGKNREPRFFDEDLDEHQPFPQLADALDMIDLHTGFNIEIKWSQRLKDGSWELNHSQIDQNLYIDCILDVVLAKSNGRRIIFSCFDSDICAMLRYKQSVYPVMFLNLGVTSRYPSYFDERCNSVEKAVQNACAMEFLGIVAHTEDLLRDSTQVKLATDQGLIIFCWGDDNNCKDTIQHLKKLGLHAIIYDKMDVLSTKENSIFLVGAQQSQGELLKIQQLEMERRAEFENENGHEIVQNVCN